MAAKNQNNVQCRLRQSLTIVYVTLYTFQRYRFNSPIYPFTANNIDRTDVKEVAVTVNDKDIS